jgi:hypothetical protein
VFTIPSIELPPVETSFLTEFRTVLSNIDGSIELDEDFAAPLQRVGDFHLMEHIVMQGTFNKKEI